MQKVLSTIDFQPADYQLSATFRMLSDFQRLATFEDSVDFGDFQGSPGIAGAASAGKDQRKNGRKTVK
jgi:hypothetical protein